MGKPETADRLVLGAYERVTAIHSPLPDEDTEPTVIMLVDKPAGVGVWIVRSVRWWAPDERPGTSDIVAEVRRMSRLFRFIPPASHVRILSPSVRKSVPVGPRTLRRWRPHDLGLFAQLPRGGRASRAGANWDPALQKAVDDLEAMGRLYGETVTTRLGRQMLGAAVVACGPLNPRWRLHPPSAERLERAMTPIGPPAGPSGIRMADLPEGRRRGIWAAWRAGRKRPPGPRQPGVMRRP